MTEPHPIDEVYEKFKHLNKCLSDTEWCNTGGCLIGVAGELWRAIKEERASHSSAKESSEKVLDSELITEIIGTLTLVEGFVPTAIRSEVMRLREKLAELRAAERERG